MVDYEKGTPAWDIGMVLTRHADGLHKGHHGTFDPCVRVLELRATAMKGVSSEIRLSRALQLECTCGAGDSDSERSSLGGTNGPGQAVS